MEKLLDLFYASTGVCTDSRNIVKDCLFIALSGLNFNGNEFAKDALDKGAIYCIVDDARFANNTNCFLVENCLQFLQYLAQQHRMKFSIPVIGITGSNGKTSTKELVNAVLAEKYKVLCTIGNLNNHIGVPLTLLRLTEQHNIAIIEMGANKHKDIEELCAIARPTHGIITNIGKAHLEGFGDFNGVLKTKKELYDTIESAKGLVVYNADDVTLQSNLPNQTNVFSYGTDNSCNIAGELVALTPFIQFRWSKSGYHSPVLTGNMVGKYNFYNYLAAIAFGDIFHVSEEAINRGIASYMPENNRSQVKKTERNTLILDCYNANPTSMLSALESFHLLESNQKLVILGDMLELGKETAREHANIAKKIKELNVRCITIGQHFFELDTTAIEQKFLTKEDAILYLKQTKISDQYILLKGSRGIGLEELETYL